jgi:hypothetical protein
MPVEGVKREARGKKARIIRILCGYLIVMKRFLVNQHPARLGMEQPALLRHVGSTAASLHASSGLGWKGARCEE